MKKYLACYLLFSLFVLSVYSQQEPKIPYGNNPEAGKFYEVRGFKMYCEIYGSGKPLLLIHGNSGAIGVFRLQIPVFAQKYKVIIADSRSQGKSTDGGDSLSYEMMADDYAALLDELKIDSAYVVGWSDGGINGLLLAMRHPEKVSKLAITGANLWPDTTAVFQEVIDLVKPRYTQLKENITKTAREKNQWKLIRLLLDEPHIPLAALQKVKCPTLVIGGDHDLIKEEHTMLIFKNIPRAYLWILPNSGHSPLIAYKDLFNTTVGDFFEKPYRKIEKEGRFY
jgi:pimeloyl-ACP methyl ester carboxylesterase